MVRVEGYWWPNNGESFDTGVQVVQVEGYRWPNNGESFDRGVKVAK